ncbi:MAG: mechanosensitive ion channel family protein [Myxococcota bacterium]
MNVDEAFGKIWVKLDGWIDGLITMLPNLVVALVLLIVSFGVAKLGRYATCQILRRLRVSESATNLVGRVVQIGVVIVGLAIALSVLELDKAVTSLLAGVGIVGLALGFAFQDLASNFISGVALSLRSRYPFKIGDLVETNEVLGIAERVYLRNTVIRTLDGHAVVIPNRNIFENKLLNYSGDPYRRVDIPCGISYGEDLREVKRIVTEAVTAIDGRIEERDVEFFWTGYGDSSIDFEVRFWIPFQKQTDFLAARSEAVMRIKEAFNDNGITIPFPIRTLDFGIKGGEKLDEMFPVPIRNAS